MINVNKKHSFDYDVHLEATFQSRLTDNLFLQGGFFIMLLDDVVKEFLFELQVKNYTPRTIKGYKNNIFRFAEYCKQEFNLYDREEVNQVHIKKYFQYLLAKGRSSVYVNNILKNIRSFFKYCYKEEYINRNIALKVEWQKEQRTVIKTFINAKIRMVLPYLSV